MAATTDELIVRLINGAHFEPNAPIGRRVKSPHMVMSECIPVPPNQGPSVYLNSKLIGGIAALESECSKWRNYGYAIVKTSELKAMNVSIVHSPQNCPFAKLQDAHYSLVGIDTRAKRDDVLGLIDRAIVRLPQP